MLCCVFFGFVLTCIDLREVVDTIARVCSIPPSVPQPCAVAMLNHYDQRLSWSKIRLQEKTLEFIAPSSTTDAWITALTPGHDLQHKHTSTEMFKGTSSCASVFFPLFYVTLHQNRGLHVDGCSGISHEHLAVCSAPGFFFLFFKNQL